MRVLSGSCLCQKVKIEAQTILSIWAMVIALNVVNLQGLIILLWEG